MSISSVKPRSVTRLSRVSGVVIAMLMLLSPARMAAASNDSVTHEMEKVAPSEFNGDVRNLPQYTLRALLQKQPYVHPLLKLPAAKKLPVRSLALKTLSINVPLAPMPGPMQNFAGLSFSDSCGGGQCGGGIPPDPNGDVGPNHYIQAVNNAYAIYDKTGALLTSFTENSLWSSSGSNPCNGNSRGDPVVLYDQLADRWILSHFAFAMSGGTPVTPFYQCIAVSKTGDPVSGHWWLYPLRMDPGGTGPAVGTMNDYVKLGIWTDCLYLSANEFTEPAGSFAGTSYASLSRSDLESGAPLTWSLGFLDNTHDAFTMIPSNLLGSSSGSLPPAGTPNYFVSETITPGFSFEVRKFMSGPNCGNGGTLSAPVSVSQASYASPSFPSLISQPGTTYTLDNIDERLMQKVQYRKIGVKESLWVVHNIQSASTGTMGMQWAQIDVTGGTIATIPVQQQNYIPDTTLNRWMGSLAVDKDGNMALGYSTSSSTLFPSIAYAGRLSTDPPNTLPQTETQLIAGGGSQTVRISGSFIDRWGDYTSMSVDPADDCTFWYTNQYYSSSANGSSGNWQTRIGSFKFPSCVPQTTPSVPTITTTAITGISAMSAGGGGDVISDGGAVVTDRGVRWSMSSDPTTTTAIDCTHDGVGTGIFISFITSLISNTTYHVRSYATNTAGTAYGSDVQFTTSGPILPAPVLPTVTTDVITGTASSTAVGGGNVTSEGGAVVTARGVCWSTSANPTTADSHSIDGGGAGAFTSSITGLTLYTTYHVRAYATSSAGTAYGNEVTFPTGVRPKRPTGFTVR